MPDQERLIFCLCLAAAGLVAVQRIALRLAAPRDASRPLSAPGSLPGDLIAALAGIQLFALFLLLTARPFTAAGLTLCAGGLLLCLNRVKEKVLREPLVLVDAYLLPQVFRYPELYFPFLPLMPLCAGAIICALVLCLLLSLEPPLAWTRRGAGAITCALIAFMPLLLALRMNKGGLSLLNRVLLSLCPVSHDAVADARRNGPLASALMHPLSAGLCKKAKPDFLHSPEQRPEASRWPARFEELVFGAIPETADPELPHVLILQAESFFDIRPQLSEKGRERLGDFLPNWDKLCAAGMTLPTPDHAFGAYTMRTEFEVLTGMPAAALGPWAFNPYVLAAARPLWSLARHFKRLGYETLCVHPYWRHFFARHTVMPHLGFDRFLALEDLKALPRYGPHVSDLALGEEILSGLQTSARPVFCFAITMEAHGPWLPGRLTASQLEETLEGTEYTAFSLQMQYYLCHLRRMDRLMGLFTQPGETPEARDSARQCLVWAYGDHAPALAIQPSH